MEKLGKFTGHGEPMPMDAMAAVQLLDLFRDPDHDVDRIVEFISQDPWLTAETLRRSNNTVYSGAERTTDIFEAVSRLGFYELYGIIAAATGAHRPSPEDISAADKEALWDATGNLR